MASKAIEEKKQEMEATMVNLGDKVGSNIQQGLTSLPVGGAIRRVEDQDYQATKLYHLVPPATIEISSLFPESVQSYFEK